MKKIFSLLIISAWSLAVYSQGTALTRKDSIANGVAYVSKKLAELSEMGVEIKNDSFIVKEEVIKLLKDDAYRRSIYPDKYEWPGVVASFRSMEFKKAFWQLINLYETDKPNRNLIVGVFCAYDSLFKMDKVLLNAFYTYAIPDPKVCRITDNKPDIYRPDILEQKLAVTREIINHILVYREQRAAAKK